MKSIDIYLNDNEILFYYTKSNHDVELDCNHLVQSIGSWFVNWFRNWTNQSFKDRLTGNVNYEGSLQLFNFKGDWIINPITPFSKRWKIWLMKLGALQKGFHFGKIFKPICNREKIIIEGKYTEVFSGYKKLVKNISIHFGWFLLTYILHNIALFGHQMSVQSMVPF